MKCDIDTTIKVAEEVYKMDLSFLEQCVRNGIIRLVATGQSHEILLDYCGGFLKLTISGFKDKE